MSSAFSDVSRVSYSSTCTCGLTSRIRSRADSSFGRPTSLVPCSTCRWRFDTSTTSKSTSPSVPTPAAARYNASGEPRPPAPMRRMRAALSRRCPSTPTSGRIRCLLYRRISSLVRGGAFPLVCAIVLPSGDRRDDRQLVAIAHRSAEASVKADVLVVQVVGDERIWLAALIAQPRRERRKARHDVGDDVAHGRTVGVDDPAVGKLGQHGRKMQRDRHGTFLLSLVMCPRAVESKNRPGGECRRARRFLAPCLTWRQ